MSVSVTLAGTDRSSWIDSDSLQVQQILGAQRDTAALVYKKFGSRSYTPTVLDTVLIQDGSTKVFGGRIAVIKETPLTEASGIVYELDCVDYGIDLDSVLVAQRYTNQTVKDIIDDFVANYATAFTDTNTVCDTVIADITFNQVPISQAIKKLADLVQFDWYVDPDKDIHFFAANTASAPFNLTDIDGNHVSGTLETDIDGTQIANQVKVRGGTYQGATFSDTITVKGSVTKSWVLPYKFDVTTLAITINGTSKTVGVYGIDTFSTKDVLYRDSDQSIQIASALSDGDTVAFSGTPLIPVLSMAGDMASMATYGTREKIIIDSSITDLNVARVRAIAEVAAYKDPQTNGQFVTYTAGLRTGQTINLNSTIRGLNVDFIIKQVTFQMRTPTAFAYTVQLVSVKSFTLIEVLQSLLLPADTPIDPNEVLETIREYDDTITSSDAYSHDTPTHPLEILRSSRIHADPGGSDPHSMNMDATSANVLIVCVAYQVTMTGITFNGSALTQDLSFGTHMSIWRLNSPTTGTHTLNFVGMTAADGLEAVAFMVKGINTADPVEATASGNATSPHKSLSATEATSQLLSIAFFMADLSYSPANGTWTPDSGSTEQFQINIASGGLVGVAYTICTGFYSRSGSKTVGSTFSNTPSVYNEGEGIVLYNGFNPTT